MASNRRTYTIAFVGIITVVLTIFIFFMATSEWVDIKWLGLMFTLLAECTLFGGMLLIEKTTNLSFGLLLRSGVYSLLTIYFVLATACSVVFMNMDRNHTKLFITIQVIIIGMVAIMLLLIVAWGKKVAEQNDETQTAVSKLQGLADRVLILQQNVRYAAYAPGLTKAYEGIRYCDNSIVVPTDNIIANQVMQLEAVLEQAEQNGDKQVLTIVDQIILLTKQRAAEAKRFKMGGI